jgi:hypothetical protein
MMKYYFIFDGLFLKMIDRCHAEPWTIDRRILNALQLDASHTNAELARTGARLPPTCLRRVKR